MEAPRKMRDCTRGRDRRETGRSSGGGSPPRCPRAARHGITTRARRGGFLSPDRGAAGGDGRSGGGRRLLLAGGRALQLLDHLVVVEAILEAGVLAGEAG